MSARRATWAAGLALAGVALAGCSSSPASPLRAVPATVTSVAPDSTVPSADAAVPAAVTTTTAPAGGPAATVPGVEPAAGAAPGSAASVAPVTVADLGPSWRGGCPVAPDRLRLVTLAYWGFDDRPHEGSLVVAVEVTDAIVAAFRRLYDERFPIRRMEPVAAFGGDDDASMAADNTSAFNCRPAVAAGPVHWSAHAHGQAVDVNPVENPYLLGGEVLPPEGADYLDRSDVRPGMAVAGGPLVEAFEAVGWSWGGTWSSPDYQHFSATGG